MASSEFIFDVTTENFEAEVLEASFQTPVLVDFWAPWCGPCRMLMPLLEKVVGGFGGALRLGKVNADEEGQIAASFGVRSLPTVVLLKDGKPLDGFMGAQPENAIRAFLAKHLAPVDEVPEETEEVAASENLDEAVAAAREAVASAPKDEPPKAVLADLLLRSGDFDEAQALIDGLSDSGRGSAEGVRVLTRLKYVQIALGAPAEAELQQTLQRDPKNLQARHHLGVRYLCVGDDQAALEQFLKIVETDRKFEDDIGRRSLVDAFSLIDDQALVGDYRRRMSSLLF